MITLGITVHDESGELNSLLNKNAYADCFSEVVVVCDAATPEVRRVIGTHAQRLGTKLRVFEHALDGDFAQHKNFLNEQARGAWVFQLDADETAPDTLVKLLPALAGRADKDGADAYMVPRLNIVDGITLADIEKWRWRIVKVDGAVMTTRQIPESGGEMELLEKCGLIISKGTAVAGMVQVVTHVPAVNFPDYQCRFFRHTARWDGRVHEQIFTQQSKLLLPAATAFALVHHKTIERQRKQNAFYEKLYMQPENAEK